MKLKHWQGYGVINAVKVRSKDFTLVVKVSGNHEWGLRRDDMYDLYRWLVQRFDKSLKDVPYAEFARMRPEVYIQHWEYDDVEYCQYSFRYHK